MIARWCLTIGSRTYRGALKQWSFTTSNSNTVIKGVIEVINIRAQAVKITVDGSTSIYYE